MQPIEDLLVSSDKLLAHEKTGVLSYHELLTSKITQDDIVHAKMWLHDVAIDWDLASDTFFLSLNILHAYASRSSTIKKTNLDIVATTVLVMSCKYNEVGYRSLEDYVALSSGVVSRSNIIEKEKEIFTLLGCNINVPNDMRYLTAISKLARLTEEVENYCRIILIVVSIAGISYLPSVVVTSIVKLVLAFYSYDMPNYFEIDNHAIDMCCYEITLQCTMARLSSYYSKMPAYMKALWLIPATTTNINASMVLVGPYMKYTYFKRVLNVPPVDMSSLNQNGRKLGQGAYGKVNAIAYKGTTYAVKTLTGLTMILGGLPTSFIREVSIIKSLNHPNVIKVRHVSSNLRSLFLDKGIDDLSTWVSNNTLGKKLQSLLANQMFSALSYIHSMGCIHRDIKPGNIIVFEQGFDLNFVLSDFGLARGTDIVPTNNLFTTNVCTMWYKAPELLLGNKSYGAGIDVWSMGCTLYQAATTMVLFKGTSDFDQLTRILGTPPTSNAVYPSVTKSFKVNHKLSPMYTELIPLCLVLDPNDRETSTEIYDRIVNNDFH
jgi:hypothetical protein